ncbi:hypothetical protein D3C71_1595490 [compost metagenome]
MAGIAFRQQAQHLDRADGAMRDGRKVLQVTHDHVGIGRRMQVAMFAFEEDRSHLLDHAVVVVHPIDRERARQRCLVRGVVDLLLVHLLPAAAMHEHAAGGEADLLAVALRGLHEGLPDDEGEAE